MHKLHKSIHFLSKHNKSTSKQKYKDTINIKHTDVFLEGECYGKLAVSIRPVKNHIRIPAKLANLGGQVQVGTIMAKVTKFGETSFWEYEKRRSEVCTSLPF